jgi:hypothetical protein
MAEYYVFQTKAHAEACIAAINVGSGQFPIVGKVNATFAPQNTQTTQWVTEPSEMITGEWAVQRMPPLRVVLLQPQPTAEEYANFIASFAQDIRILSRRVDLKL